MDEALKARLVGAAVLVALAVLVVPELLSGRKPEALETATPAATHGTRTFTIELAGGAPPSATSAPPVAAPQTAGTPVPAGGMQAEPRSQAALETAQGARAAPASTSASSPLPVTAQPSIEQGRQAQGTAPTASPLPAAAQAPVQSIPARGGWAVQVGAFGTPAAADKVVRELQSSGYKAYVAPVSRSGKTLYRVRVGPEAERSRAEALAVSLKGRSLPATVVAND